MQVWLKGALLQVHLLLALLVSVLLSSPCLLSRLKLLSAALLPGANPEGYELPFSRLEAGKWNRAEKERRIA